MKGVIPTTYDIRYAYAHYHIQNVGLQEEEFDRWYAKNNVDVEADALEGAADELEAQMREAGDGDAVDTYGSFEQRVLNFLRYRAMSVRSLHEKED